MGDLSVLETLRGRLLVWLAIPLLLVLGLSIIADYRTAMSLANESYDRMLTATAFALGSRLERDEDDQRIELDLPPAAEAILRSEADESMLYAVLGEGGRLIAGDAGLAAVAQPEAIGATSLVDVRLNNQPFRLAQYTYATPGSRATILVAETTFKRGRGAQKILSAVIWPNLLLIAVTLLLVFVVVRISLRPLDRLGALIDARGVNDLSPIPDQGIPGETRPLVRALNRMLIKLDAAGRAQQAFLSNAAHQLRTPLAGMLTQLDLAMNTFPPEAQPRLERLQSAAQRLAHLTHQMLALSRSSQEARSAVEADNRALDLGELFEDCASHFVDAAVKKDIDLGFEADPARVVGSDWMLRELLANLIDNAIKYAPCGGHVTARCATDSAGQAWLEVEDDGPGIPAAAREKVFERFYRLAGSQTPGTGLGLAIVREVAQSHGAQIQLDSGVGGIGTRVRVVFPLGS